MKRSSGSGIPQGYEAARQQSLREKEAREEDPAPVIRRTVPVLEYIKPVLRPAIKKDRNRT